ncbi:MAG: hypothetical protein V3T17_02410 [Pseudomonadales bacterium]
MNQQQVDSLTARIEALPAWKQLKVLLEIKKLVKEQNAEGRA